MMLIHLPSRFGEEEDDNGTLINIVTLPIPCEKHWILRNLAMVSTGVQPGSSFIG